MAKKKESMVDEGDEGGAILPVADPIVIPGEIHSQDQASELVHSGKYIIPEGVKMAYVTQDGNVFWPTSASAAINHSQRNNLKLFTVTCQD